MGTPMNYRFISMAGESMQDISSSVWKELNLERLFLLIVGIFLFFLIRFLSFQLIQFLEYKKRIQKWGLVSLCFLLILSSLCHLESRTMEPVGLNKNAISEIVLSSIGALLEQDIESYDCSDINKFQIANASIFEEQLNVAIPFQKSSFSQTSYNVIVYILESVAASYLSIYGGKHDNTPNLNNLKNSAIIFNDFYAHSPNSMKAIFSILTSIYPYPSWKRITSFDPDIPVNSLPRILKNRGYRTGLFHAGHFSFSRKTEFLQHHGYDILMDADKILDMNYFRNSWGVEDIAIVDRAIKWIDEDRTRPFFITLIPVFPHHPYDVPSLQWNTLSRLGYRETV
jgi:phosphoglycerol transferase MdoB-like AlkP superfamily enzyme